MKKKILLSFFTIFIVFSLIGCGVTLDTNQKEQTIKEVINNYWLALSNKQYELAKTYCIPYGDAYNAVENYQNLFDYDYITINWDSYINWINIIGNEAVANIKLVLNVTVCFDNICSTQTETLYNYSMYLIEIYNIWKLK